MDSETYELDREIGIGNYESQVLIPLRVQILLHHPSLQLLHHINFRLTVISNHNHPPK